MVNEMSREQVLRSYVDSVRTHYDFILMKDAIRHGNRLIMMNAGRIIFDVSGEAKQKLTVDDLMREFAKAGGDDIEDRALLS